MVAESPSEHFQSLGAPLRNSRWSWGAERPDGKIFLRVWQDQCQSVAGRLFVRLTHHTAYSENSENLGYVERVEHVRRLQDGATGYLIMCVPVDKRSRPRKLKSFDKRALFPLGEIREIDGDKWGEMLPRINVSEVRPIQ